MIFKLTYSTFLASSQLGTSIHWPCYCAVHFYVVIHFSDCMWSFNWKWICADVFIFVYIFIALDVSTGSTTLDCHWRSIESWVKTKQLVFRRVEKMYPYASFSALGFWALLWKWAITANVIDLCLHPYLFFAWQILVRNHTTVSLQTQFILIKILLFRLLKTTMGTNEHARLANITFIHKLKFRTALLLLFYISQSQ